MVTTIVAGGGGTPNDAIDDLTVAHGATGGWISIDLGGLGGAFGANDLNEFGLPGDTATNLSGDLGYSLVGITETITVPVDIFIPGDQFNFGLTGTIVAERTIPEPTSGLFLATLAAGAGAVVRRRRK